jgi:ketosteroid isomerase-like protein
MSEANVEIVRGLLDAFQRRGHERAFDLYDPDIEWDASLQPAPDLAGVYQGHQGVRTFWGRHTGIATEVPPYALVFSFRDSRVARWRFFPDLQSALEAVGLTG